MEDTTLMNYSRLNGNKFHLLTDLLAGFAQWFGCPKIGVRPLILGQET